jgi:hypothetical protein
MSSAAETKAQRRRRHNREAQARHRLLKGRERYTLKLDPNEVAEMLMIMTGDRDGTTLADHESCELALENWLASECQRVIADYRDRAPLGNTWYLESSLRKKSHTNAR